MRKGAGVFVAVPRLIPIAALCFFLGASTVAAQVMYMKGDISGTVNGTPVDFDLDIKLDMKTGEETAVIGNMDPDMGAILRQVPAMVTIGGPTGGSKPQGGKNLFELSKGNFVNSSTVYWPRTGDQLELIHTVSYSGGDTMKVSATMNGTVPIISGDQPVIFKDFTEIMRWGKPLRRPGAKAATQTVKTGVGFKGDFSRAQFRSYKLLEGTCEDPDPAVCEAEEGKGSTTTYAGVKPSSPILRSARDITITYDPVARTMNVHLYNTLTPIEGAP